MTSAGGITSVGGFTSSGGVTGAYEARPLGAPVVLLRPLLDRAIRKKVNDSLGGADGDRTHGL